MRYSHSPIPIERVVARTGFLRNLEEPPGETSYYPFGGGTSIPMEGVALLQVLGLPQNTIVRLTESRFLSLKPPGNDDAIAEILLSPRMWSLKN